MLYNDDYINILKTIPSNSIDLVYTDPPYDVHVNPEDTTGSCNTRMKLAKSLSPLNSLRCETFNINLFCEEMIRVLKDINIYVWCNKSQIIKYMNIFVNEYKCNYNILFWNKTNALPTYYNKYIDDIEYCLYFYTPGVYCKPMCYNDAKKLYISPINRENKIYNHPTIKPLPFVKSMLSNSTKPGFVVLDPFMGSGTTGVACKELNRDIDFIGIEINENYYKTALSRINGTEIDTQIKKKVLF